jgi:hypothetical protein
MNKAVCPSREVDFGEFHIKREIFLTVMLTKPNLKEILLPSPGGRD